VRSPKEKSIHFKVPNPSQRRVVANSECGQELRRYMVFSEVDSSSRAASGCSCRRKRAGNSTLIQDSRGGRARRRRGGTPRAQCEPHFAPQDHKGVDPGCPDESTTCRRSRHAPIKPSCAASWCSSSPRDGRFQANTGASEASGTATPWPECDDARFLLLDEPTITWNARQGCCC